MTNEELIKQKMDNYSMFIHPMDKRDAVKEALKFGYWLAQQDIEKLKGLIEEGFKLLQQQWHKPEEQIKLDWEKFKIENQLL